MKYTKQSYQSPQVKQYIIESEFSCLNTGSAIVDGKSKVTIKEQEKGEDFIFRGWD